jgi:tetratricopeptide (TPR) repeat protein
VSDDLRPLWDFGDLDASEARFREALAEAESDERRAEILTQLARVEGLRGDFAAGERLADEAAALAGASAVARARLDLERGRLRNSSGDREAALPLFESAHRAALDAGRYFVAADAAHMAALAAPGRDGLLAWTQRGLDVAEEHEPARYWRGSLLNNLGWELYEAGDFAEAADVFERALRAREEDPGNPEPIALARYALGKALRALGRSAEAVPHLEDAVAWADGEGAPDGWYLEELALEYADLGRADEAREHARRALPLLEEADPSFVADVERSSRVRALVRMDSVRPPE